MPDKTALFFENMKAQDAKQDIPSFEECLKKKKNYSWLYGLAAAVTLVAVMLVLESDPRTQSTLDVILDTGNSPTVTNTLYENEREEFLEWDAPTDYLSNDFNP